MKKGIELEYWIVNQEGELDEAQKISKDFDFADPEFVKPLLEIRTEPFEDLDEIKDQIYARVRKCVEKAHKKDLRIVPTGTPLNSGEIDLIENSKRVELEKKFFPEHNHKDRSRAGTHIHFECRNKVRQINLVTALDPVSALLNSSPYHKGDKIASSSRNYFYRYQWKCKFPENIELWPYTNSIEEWEKRIQERYKDLRKSALNSNISKDDFESSFLPEDSVWIPVRLRKEFGTVEWRSGDAAVPSEVIKLLEEISPIVESTREKQVEIESPDSNSVINLPRFKKLQQISEAACKSGLDSQLVSNHLESLGINTERFNPLTKKLEDEHTIDIEKAKDLRLKAAEILEEDVLN